ncbi:MAG: hypothetical protein SVG88_12710 [Halobacteriales archaeon]|nr:hypothetical protein [Halobacteriales archaeon]
MRRRAVLSTAATIGMAGCASRLSGLLGSDPDRNQERTPAESTLPPRSETATSTDQPATGPQPEFEVTTLQMPDSIRPYQPFHVTVGVRNRSDVTGLFWTQLVVLDNTGVADTRTLSVSVDANSVAFTELGPFVFRSYGLREIRTVDGGGMGRIKVAPVEYDFGVTHIGSRFEITIDRTAIESTVTAGETTYGAADGWRFLFAEITIKNVFDSPPPPLDSFGILAGETVIPGAGQLTRLAEDSSLDQGRIDHAGQPYVGTTTTTLTADTTTSGWAVFEVPAATATTAAVGYSRRPNVAYIIRWIAPESA